MRINVSPGEYRRIAEPGREADDQTVAAFRAASLGLAVASVLLAFALGITTAIRVDPTGIGANVWLLAMLLVISGIVAEHPRIADLTGALAVAWVGALSGGALALLGLRMHFPMTDAVLHRADQALGFDGVAFVAGLVRQGQRLFSIMGPAYAYTIPILGFSMCFLAAAGRRIEAWRACLCFNGSLLTTCVVAAVTPAKGLGVWAPPELLAHLPDRAMIYFWPKLDAFYNGTDPVLGAKALSGVISFPSFHAAMGFMVVAMWRKSPLALSAACVWLFFMLLSAFAYGGHYLVDVLAGLAIAAGWFALSRRLETRLVGLKPAPADA